MTLPMWYSPAGLTQDNNCDMLDIRFGSTLDAGPGDPAVLINSGIKVPKSANQWMRMNLVVPQSFLTYLFVGYIVKQKSPGTTGICGVQLKAMTYPGGPGDDTVLNFDELLSTGGQKNIPIDNYKLGQSLTLFIQFQIADPDDYIVIGDIGLWTEDKQPAAD